MAGMVVASFVLHWLVGLAQVVGPRSGKPSAQVVRDALVVTIANSGFWILVVAAYAAYQVFNGPIEKPWIVGSVGFASAIVLLSVIAYGFARGGSGSLLMRFAQSMRHKENFMRLGFVVGFLISAPLLYEWHEQGLSGGVLVFAAVIWAAAIYFGLWYMWQFVPWDKPGLVRNKNGGGDNAA
jgi:hypothetical protein